MAKKRHQFKKRVWFFLFIIIFTLLSLAACLQKDNNSDGGVVTDEESGAQAIQEPVKGGNLFVGSTQEPDSLNPVTSHSLAAAELTRLVFNGLLKVDNKLQYIPDLSQEVPTLQNGGVSSDGRTVTYRLKSNVSWQDGVPLTASDVVFTYQYIKKTYDETIYSEGYKKIRKVEAPDELTVVVTFDEPYPDFLSLFPCVLPQHILDGARKKAREEYDMNPVGTGPFKLQEWNKGKYLLFAANQSYFDGAPYLDAIRYVVFKDDNALLLQLKTEGMDLCTKVDEAQISRMNDQPDILVYKEPNLKWEHIDLNMNRSIFKDVKVRQAISMGIDRETIVNDIFNSAGQSSISSLPAKSWACNRALRIESANVDGAKKLLNAAGWADSDGDGIMENGNRELAFTLLTIDDDILRQQEQSMLAEQLKKIGVRVLFDSKGQDDFTYMVTHGRYDAALYAWSLTPDPDQSELWLTENMAPTGKNTTYFSNDEMDSLLKFVKNEMSYSVRRDIYFDMQRVLVREVPAVSICFRANVNFADKNLKNFEPHPVSTACFWNASEWWLDK